MSISDSFWMVCGVTALCIAAIAIVALLQNGETTRDRRRQERMEREAERNRPLALN